MDRVLVMNYLLISVTVWAWSILTHVGIAQFLSTPMQIFISYILIYFIAGLFIGLTAYKVGSERISLQATIVVSAIIILSNLLLKAKLDDVMILLTGDYVIIKSLGGAIAAMGFGFVIPLAVLIPRIMHQGSSQQDLPPSDIKLPDVILQESGIRCPICDRYPEEDGHYIIRCWYCKTEFCSKHLGQFEERCPRCYKPVPYLRELQQALQDNQAI
jgi:hypothetical protein